MKAAANGDSAKCEEILQHPEADVSFRFKSLILVNPVGFRLKPVLNQR